MGILHKESTAVSVIRDSGAGLVLDFDGEKGVACIKNQFTVFFQNFVQFFESFNPAQVDLSTFEQYSAKNVTRQLALLLNEALKK
jgi:hypothetical protein